MYWCLLSTYAKLVNPSPSFIWRVFQPLILVDSEAEATLAIQSLRRNTLSKLTFADSKKFDALVKDVFPDVTFKDVDYAELRSALVETAQEMGLIVSEVQVTNCVFSCCYSFTYMYVSGNLLLMIMNIFSCIAPSLICSIESSLASLRTFLELHWQFGSWCYVWISATW